MVAASVSVGRRQRRRLALNGLCAAAAEDIFAKTATERAHFIRR